MPLHKAEKAGIPHIPIETLLKKFDGFTNKDSSDGRRRFLITKFPRYLILYIKIYNCSYEEIYDEQLFYGEESYYCFISDSFFRFRGNIGVG